VHKTIYDTEVQPWKPIYTTSTTNTQPVDFLLNHINPNASGIFLKKCLYILDSTKCFEQTIINKFKIGINYARYTMANLSSDKIERTF